MKKVRVYFLAVLIIIIYSAAFGQGDKRVMISPSFIADTIKIHSIIRKASAYSVVNKLDSSMVLANQAHALSKKINYTKGIALSLNLQGRVLFRRANCDSAIIILNKALAMAEELNDSALQSNTLLNIGNSNAYMGNGVLAIDYYFKGLAIEEKLSSQPNLKWYFTNIGNVLTNQKNYIKALEYSLKAKKVIEHINDPKSHCLILNNIGWIYMSIKQNDSAYYYIKQSLKLAEKVKDFYTVVLCLGNLGELNITLKNYDEAYEYGYRGYKISMENGYKDQVVGNLYTLGHVQLERKNYTSAEQLLLKALHLSQKINTKELTQLISFTLASLYDKKNDYQRAYEYYQLFSVTKDSLLNQENSKLITEMNTKYTTEKKEKEIELLKKNEDIQKLELAKRKNELERQRTVSIGVFVGFLLLMIVATLMYSRYRLKKKANDQLQTAYNLIEEKNTLIEKSNLMIMDSITYAKRIQDAILPSPEEIAVAVSTDFFILYQPAQIVSGDFYWCSPQQDKTVFVVADCTGHGVPGAFMSMIGNTLLNEIVNERKITDTKQIAELLDEKIIHALHQDEHSQKFDGMDISICCIDKRTNKISFTGAHHHMYTYNGQLHKIKGDPYSIGGAQQQNSKKFTSQTIDHENGLDLYFLTDGYCDQSGGSDNKRFSSKKFENILEQIHHVEMNEQKEKLEQEFKNWKGDTKQRDDVLVVGIRC